ncbi:AMP-dependent synthetase and ligase [Cadophora sp. DSE1049]|nr:AMP-dependent synthetase and ligase [Cadophora sp. DSE1049]
MAFLTPLTLFPIDVLYWTEDNLTISAGRLIPNYSIYVVDKALKRLPVSIVGEICIGGPGVAAGYLHNDELTKSKFILNPFATAEQKSRGWTRIYYTGDRGSLASNGTLLFKERINGDNQVKLHGLRIELGDIESAIVRAGNGMVAEAIASVVGELAFIVAYVVLSNVESENQ